MAILVLAANTAYADFPRLASVVARDRYMPRQFMNQGDKLAFSNGIVALSVAAGGLIWVFEIKGALLFRPNVVVTSVPFHLR